MSRSWRHSPGFWIVAVIAILLLHGRPHRALSQEEPA